MVFVFIYIYIKKKKEQKTKKCHGSSCKSAIGAGAGGGGVCLYVFFFSGAFHAVTSTTGVKMKVKQNFECWTLSFYALVSLTTNVHGFSPVSTGPPGKAGAHEFVMFAPPLRRPRVM